MNKTDKKRGKTFLVINTGYFGDTLLTAKLTRDIKTNYPESFLIFIVDSPYEEIAKGLPGVDAVVPYNRKTVNNLKSYLRFLLDFPWKNKIDVAFIAQSKKNSRNILAFFLGAKKILTFNKFAYSKNCSKFVTENIVNNRFCCMLANMLFSLTGKITDDEDIEYSVSDNTQKKVDDYLNRINKQNNLIAINPLASSGWKNWELFETIKFTKLLINEGKTVVLTGVSKDDPEYIKAFHEQIG